MGSELEEAQTVRSLGGTGAESSASARGYEDVLSLIDDRPVDGVFAVHPRLYSDPTIFDLEMEHIFARTWVYLGHASQLAGDGGYFTSKIGRSPILVTRRGTQIFAFLNVCRHKGAILCRLEEGSAKAFTCPYHSWTYSNSGRLLGIKDRRSGHYPASFEDDDHDLTPIAGIASYNGLIFGSLSPDTPTLEEFLGDLRPILDIILAQGPSGMELIPGRAPYRFRANWKLQLDNGLDPYHVTSAHLSLVNMQKRRKSAEAVAASIRGMDWDKLRTVEHHAFNLRHGHAAYVSDNPKPEDHVLAKQFDALRGRLGDTAAAAMLKGYQLHIFPNLQIASSVTTIIRRFHPVSVDETEMDVRCLGAVGESVADRQLRLRQFEDFFGAAGLASPDDSIIYEDCQRGFSSPRIEKLQGYVRGIALAIDTPNAQAREFGIRPDQCLSGPASVATELNLHSPYREWRRMMDLGLRGEAAWG